MSSLASEHPRAPVPEDPTPQRVHEAIVSCRACDLYKGATAAQALLGSHIRIGRDRGQEIESELAELVTLTTHPSAILRVQDEPERIEAMTEFVADLQNVAQWLSAK